MSLRVKDSKTVTTNNLHARTGAKDFKYGRVLDETTPQVRVYDMIRACRATVVLRGNYVAAREKRGYPGIYTVVI